MTSLLGWLDDPSAETGICFRTHDGWDRHSYQQIAASALRVAGCLAQVAGAGARDVVSIALPPGPEFAEAFFGVLAAGLTPNPVPPPAFFASSDGYVEHTARLLRTSAPGAVLTDAAARDLIERVRRAAGGDFPVITTGDTEQAAPLAARRPPAGIALLQFTSGSSGQPKVVPISGDNLEANVAGMAEWVGMGPDDVTATWLPVHHDMGLIGCLLTPAATGSGVLALSPVDFIRSPLTWLECFGKLGATFTASPTFGLTHVLRRLKSTPADPGWDFSRWRGAVIGAERVDVDVLRRFASALRPYGFEPTTLCPAYGLAESTLAVTGLRPGNPVRWLSAEGQQGRVAGCGTPVAGAEIRILDEAGTALPDGRLGEITIRGRCVAAEYRTSAGSRPLTDGDGWLRTGDAGFLDTGELFVVGRMGDALKVRGRTIFAEDVEDAVAARLGVARHRVVALLGTADSVDTAVILLEEPGELDQEEVALVLRSQVGPDIRQRIFRGPSGCITRTTSGKPRRRVMWQRLTGSQPPPDVAEYHGIAVVAERSGSAS
jgi:acyl-CoA synthetase (AMP-forming)/AMP-acid ligase II